MLLNSEEKEFKISLSVIFCCEQPDRQGMTQADILGLANTGNRFIVELENGKPTVRLDKVLAVLDVLGLELRVRQKGRR